MKIKIVALFFLVATLTAFTVMNDKGTVVKAEAFNSYIDTIGLKFIMPPDHQETYVRESKDLWYGFAIRDKNADFEVRYSVWSLVPSLIAYEKCKLDTNCVMFDPNLIYKGRIQANIFNMTGGQNWGFGEFPTEAVKKEFNADYGGSSFFEFNCDFGIGFKYGQMVYLHKDNVADVIITYMSNDKESHTNLMSKSFLALTFK